MNAPNTALWKLWKSLRDSHELPQGLLRRETQALDRLLNRGNPRMVHLLRQKATPAQLAERLETLGAYIELAVDIEQEILAGSGALHADCEAVLLEAGSRQADIRGADWIPSSQEARYEALINIRPSQNNPSVTILDAAIQARVKKVAEVSR